MKRAAGNIDRRPSACWANRPFVVLSSQTKFTADKSPPTTMPTQNRTFPKIKPATAAATTATAIRAKILAREYPRMPVSGSVWTSIAKRTFYPDFEAKIKVRRFVGIENRNCRLVLVVSRGKERIDLWRGTLGKDAGCDAKKLKKTDHAPNNDAQNNAPRRASDKQIDEPAEEYHEGDGTGKSDSRRPAKPESSSILARRDWRKGF